MTRGDFLGLGLMGTIMGAVLTIPPVAFILGPDHKDQRPWPVERDRRLARGRPGLGDPRRRARRLHGRVPDQPGLRRQEDRRGERGRRGVGVHDQERHLARGGTRSSRRASRGPPATSWEGACAPTSWTRERGVHGAGASAAGGSINVLANACATWGPVRWLVNTDGEGEFLCRATGISTTLRRRAANPRRGACITTRGKDRGGRQALCQARVRHPGQAGRPASLRGVDAREEGPMIGRIRTQGQDTSKFVVDWLEHRMGIVTCSSTSSTSLFPRNGLALHSG